MPLYWLTIPLAPVLTFYNYLQNSAARLAFTRQAQVLLSPSRVQSNVAELVLLPQEGGRRQRRRWHIGVGGVQRRQRDLVQGRAQDGEATGRSEEEEELLFT